MAKEEYRNQPVIAVDEIDLLHDETCILCNDVQHSFHGKPRSQRKTPGTFPNNRSSFLNGLCYRSFARQVYGPFTTEPLHSLFETGHYCRE
jgi:hypothetical protein